MTDSDLPKIVQDWYDYWKRKSVDGGPWWGLRSHLPLGHKDKHRNDPPVGDYEVCVGERRFKTWDKQVKYHITQHLGGWLECIG